MADSIDTVLLRMLNEIDDMYDKTVGSFTRDILTPAATEAVRLELFAEYVLSCAFVDTAEGEWLDALCKMQGLIRRSATYASGTVTITGRVGKTVLAGTLVASDTAQYVATDNTVIGEDGTAVVNVTAITAGKSGCCGVGAINRFPVSIEGIYSVTNKAAFTNGYNTETDDELRERYYTKVRTPTTSGNAYHYRQWALEVDGVGDAQVVPLWNGNGTVKVYIIDTEKLPASDELVEKATKHIDKQRPIGASVTVSAPEQISIDVSVVLSIANGYAENDIKSNIEAQIKQYIRESAFIKSAISYAKIGSIILDTQGVTDYTDLTVNGGTANVSIDTGSVAVWGGVTYGS